MRPRARLVSCRRDAEWISVGETGDPRSSLFLTPQAPANSAHRLAPRRPALVHREAQYTHPVLATSAHTLSDVTLQRNPNSQTGPTAAELTIPPTGSTAAFRARFTARLTDAPLRFWSVTDAPFGYHPSDPVASVPPCLPRQAWLSDPDL